MRFYLLAVLFLLACSTTVEDSDPIHFVSHGIFLSLNDSVLSINENGKNVVFERQRFAKQSLLAFQWTPEKTYQIVLKSRKLEKKAPLQAMPYLYDTIDLEDASQLASIGNFPDTDAQFDRQTEHLAIGSYYGFVRLYSLKQKRVLWEKKLSEGMAKRVQFSPDGKTLYVGEQSVDGFFYAFETATGNELWKYRLADDIETSTPPQADDMYGIYSLPAVFRIQVVDEQSILVAGLHSWFDGKTYQRKSKLYSFSANGSLNWSFPQKALRANIQHFDATKEFIAFSVSGLQKEFASESIIKESSVVLLSTATGELLDQQQLQPLKPYFDRVTFWQSINLEPSNQFVTMGSYDGRGFHFPIKNGQFSEPVTHNFGTPIFADSVPIMAGISFTDAISNIGFYSVNQSSIPYSYAKDNGLNSPPMLHPASGSIFAVNQDGTIIWKHQDGLVYSAIDHSQNEQWLLATIDDKTENREKGLFGFTLFKQTKNAALPFEKIYTYNSLVPVFFNGAISNNGLFKLCVTSPFIPQKDDVPRGRYQIQIVM
jgi:outer membrane protein assembly factor BamB